MSEYLANLLSKEKLEFKKLINDIEHASGHLGHDLKLASEIKIATNYKLKALGLNPDDTTAEELYHSLNNLFSKHDQFLVNKLGITIDSPVSLALQKIADNFNKSDNLVKSFSIKASILRKILAKNKPLVTIKLLGYRSFDSLLKSEDPKTVISLACYLESESWTKQYLNLLKSLTSNDFEYKTVKTLVLSDKKFQKISKEIIAISGYNVVAIENIGQILIVPFEAKLKPGFCLLSFAYISYRLTALLRFSKFIENNRFNSSFGVNIARYPNSTEKISFSISKHSFSWDRFSALYSNLQEQDVDRIIDFETDSTSGNEMLLKDIMISLEPALGFWTDCEYLGFINNQKIVSLNLLDVCYNFYNNLDYTLGISTFMETSLETELVKRYLSSRIVTNHVNQQIIDDPGKNEFIQIFKNRVVYS